MRGCGIRRGVACEGVWHIRGVACGGGVTCEVCDT